MPIDILCQWRLAFSVGLHALNKSKQSLAYLYKTKPSPTWPGYPLFCFPLAYHIVPVLLCG